MRRPIGAAVAIIALTAPATAAPSTVSTYNHLRAKVAHKFGARAPGRNIAEYGYRGKRGVRDATKKDIRKSNAVLRRMLAPPPPPRVVQRAPVVAQSSYVAPRQTQSYVAPRQTYHAPTQSSSTGSLPPKSITDCESGGSYRAYNPSSGAGGKYQIIPSTWAAHGGTGSPQTASPAEQDRVASRIWNGGAGRSQWAC